MSNWFSRIELPPLLVALTLVTEVGIVYTIDRWVLHDGKAAAVRHAEQRIREEVQQRFQQGVVMLHLQQFDHALTAFHRVLQLSPQMPEAHVNMGFVMLGMGKPKEAHDFFSGALALRPEQRNAYYGAALALHAMGNLEDALVAMHGYLVTAEPDDPYRTRAEQKLKEWRDAGGGQAADLPAGKQPKTGKVGAGGTAH